MMIYVAEPKGRRESFLTPKAVEEVKKLGNTVFNDTDKTVDAELIKEQCPDAEIMIIGWSSPKYTAEFLDAMPKLKMICYMGGGIEDIITDEVEKRGIILLSGNRVFAYSVAEGCLAYTLVALRRLEHYMECARRGEWWWKNNDFNNRGIIGKKIGLVGFGTVAKFYAQILSVFDVEILAASNYLTEEEADKYGVKKATYDEIFSTCDIISVHLALNDKTKGLIDRKYLEKIKQGALFVNTARGAVVDEEAMVELLKENRFHAVLDVFSVEPIPVEGHFLSPLLKMDNVTIIPHMAGPTLDMRERVVLELAKDIRRFYNNEPLVNKANIR